MVTLKQAMKMVNNFNDTDDAIHLVNVPKSLMALGSIHWEQNGNIRRTVCPREIKERLDLKHTMVYKIVRQQTLYGEDDGWKFFCKFPK